MPILEADSRSDFKVAPAARYSRVTSTATSWRTGWSAESAIRRELCDEAIHLATLPETFGCSRSCTSSLVVL